MSFQELFDDVRDFGEETPSRYGDTLERWHASVTFPAGEMVIRKGINYGIGWMETLQLIAGVFDPLAIARVAPNARLELFTASMAYGPRVKDQLPGLVDYLRREPLGRQATLFIGRPENGCSSDQPCTTAIHFLSRGHELRAQVAMRSWDVVKGMAYDVMMFGGLTQALASCLNLFPGYVTVVASSAHIYKNELSKRPAFLQPRFELPPFASLDQAQAWAMEQVETLMPGEVPHGVEVHGMPVEAVK